MALALPDEETVGHGVALLLVDQGDGQAGAVDPGQTGLKPTGMDGGEDDAPALRQCPLNLVETGDLRVLYDPAHSSAMEDEGQSEASGELEVDPAQKAEFFVMVELGKDVGQVAVGHPDTKGKDDPGDIAHGAAAIGTWSNYISSYRNYDESEILMFYDDAGIAAEFTSVGAGSPTAWCAAIFTPGITGTLKSVDFWVVSDDASYEIKIYDNMVNGTMKNLLSITRGTCKETGYYSIPLFFPVSVNSGDDFVVTVKLTTLS